MNHDLTIKTRRALKKYGYANCSEAYRLHFKKGEGARTIAITIQCSCIRTTADANAAIDAGRELHYASIKAQPVSF